jgi:cytochrome c-type biogenesis protein CcmE
VEHYEGYFTFTMKDAAGLSLKVRYEGAKPLNFEHAANVVALGSYNAGEKRFEAEKLLVKCPSKYQRKTTL